MSVVEGVVTLRGTVQSYRRKLVAQETATVFHGCRGVDNQLTVAPTELATDEAVAAHVRAGLEAHADVTKQTITVSVEGGVVTLGGTVERPWERDLEEDVAVGVRGVREVKNRILADPAEQEEDEALSRTISAALAVTRGLRNAVVRVAVSGGRVVLSGEVEKLWQKVVAATVVRRFQPLWITDEITVVNPSTSEQPGE